MVIATLATIVLSPTTSLGGTRPPVDWDATARVEAFHVTDLFPGDPRQADNGVRFDLRPALDARVGGGVHLKPWLRLVAERYRVWRSRDLERWGGGLDVKKGPHRLRVYGGWTPDELYFPSTSGDARLDREIIGAELRLGLRPRWLAKVEGERERDDFNSLYDERDATRWSMRTGVEWGLDVGRSISVTHLYRRNDSITDLYTYDNNALRGTVRWSLSSWSIQTEGEASLRNYRTPHAYDRNAARQDARWRVAASLGRSIAPHVAAETYGEYRENDSTRPGKTYQVATIGVAMEVAR